MQQQAYIYNLGLAFQQVAARFAKRIALRFLNGEEYTYEFLHQYSNQVAAYLTQQGLKKGDVIAIFNDKSIQGYSIMLACLKIGVVYTNLDSSSPWERVKKILITCQPKILFLGTEDVACRDNLMEQQEAGLMTKSIGGDDFRSTVDRFDPSDLDFTQSINGSDPAYIMFTSGSTGVPKGAVMSHLNVLNFIAWGRQTFEVTPDHVFTNVNPIYFDNSVFDFYVSLFNGATLVPVGAEVVKSPRSLVDAINETQCTIWFSVPSLLVYLLTTKSLRSDDFSSIRRIAFGGEGFPKNKLKQLYDLYHQRIVLFNVYGPTECTCICSSYIISEVDFVNMDELAPLGFLAPNFDYVILPLDEEKPGYGELALMGPCVGLGYYNDPDRTSMAFVQNPFASFHQRMYKTGDLVWKSENGHLHFKGRVDNQIKHMGYRIELEEVEAACSSLSYVDEVGVIYERITTELGQIKAFMKLNDVRKDPKFIQNDLRKILPPYMIPKIHILAEPLPKNRNGKIDRRQLAGLLN